MELFHTSPAKIEEIDQDGMYDEFLFFKCTPYDPTNIVYKIEIDESGIIEASQLFYSENAEVLKPLLERVASRYGVSEETAESLIEESVSIYDVESNVDACDLRDASWDIQRITARAAKMLGFRAVAVTDENGGVYMIDMLGRENELRLV